MKKKRREDSVSPVIGEALMIGLVIMLIPLVTISVMNQIPENRVPTVTILLDNTADTLTLYHKGGDYLVKDDISVIIRHDNVDTTFRSWSDQVHYSTDARAFDLGDTLTITGIDLDTDDSVRVVTHNAVIFTGVIT